MWTLLFQVEFERVKQLEDAQADSKVIKRVLFGRNNPYPQNKLMTFNKHMQDFTFNVAYAEADFLTEGQAKYGQIGLLTFEML